MDFDSPGGMTTQPVTDIARPFSSYQQLTVRQRKSWTEILMSFETRNKYDVYDESGMPVLVVEETETGIAATLGRLFLGPLRAFQSEVREQATGRTLLRLHRPFRWVFHELHVEDVDGQRLGTVRRRWSWFQRIYEIEDRTSGERMEIFGPFFRPWTFELRQHGQTLGAIRKRWSGFGKEVFTDADNFGIELGMIPSASLRALAFSATVLIDVVHFERAK